MSKRFNPIFWIITLAAVFIVCTNSITDADFWWHLKTGEYIWQTKSIFHQDFFSYTADGRQWTVHEWLSQVILYLAYRIRGFDGPVYLSALMAAAVFGVLALVMRLNQTPEIISQSAIFIGAVVAGPFFIPRPQIFYFLFWAVLILMLTIYEKRQNKVIFLIPLLILFWANFHASIHLPLLLLGLFIIGKALPFFLEKKKGFWQEHQGIIIVTLVGALLALINPNSFQVYTYVFKGIPFLKKTTFEITEWGSLLADPMAWQAWFFLGFYLLVVAAFVLNFLKWRNMKTIEKAVVVLPLILIGLLVSKFLPLSLLVAVPFLGTNLKELFQTRPLGKFKEKSINEFRIEPIINLGLAIVFLGLAVVYHYLLGRPIKPAWHNFPQKAIDFVLEEKIKGPMYNPYNWGGFLIWRLYPQYKVFIDGRYEMFEPDITGDHEIVQGGLEGWEEVLDKYEINFLIVPTREIHLGLANSTSWVMVYFDDLAVIYVRNKEENKALIDKFGYLNIRPFLPSVYSEKGKERQAIGEYKRALEITPGIFKAHYDLGVIYINLEEYQEAEKHFRKAIEIFPKSARSHYNLGFCLEKQGRLEEAEGEYLEYQFWGK